MQHLPELERRLHAIDLALSQIEQRLNNRSCGRPDNLIAVVKEVARLRRFAKDAGRQVTRALAECEEELRRLSRSESEKVSPSQACAAIGRALFAVAAEYKIVSTELDRLKQDDDRQRTIASRHPWVIGVLSLSASAAVCLGAGALITWGQGPFSDLSAFMTAHMPLLVSGSAILGLAAGWAYAFAGTRTAGDAMATALRDGLLNAGAAVLGVLTIIGGTKAVEHFRFGSGPQVMFVGSGTVHRYLFGSAEDALQIRLGARLGKHEVMFWGFEGPSDAGLHLAAYAYDHHGDRITENKVPLIGMASYDVVRKVAGEVRWSEDGEAYFRCAMRPANRDADDFAVIPLVVDLKPLWYVTPPESLGQLQQLPPIWRSAPLRCQTLFPSRRNVTLHLPGSGSGTLRGAVTDRLPSSIKPTNSGSYLLKDVELFPKDVVSKDTSNFSLNLDHITATSGTIHVAIGNFALVSSANAGKWVRASCEGCKERDLVLIVHAMEDETEHVWRLPPYVCVAVQYLYEDKGQEIEKYVEFDDCSSKLLDPGKCLCKLTAAGEGLLLKDMSVYPDKCGGAPCACEAGGEPLCQSQDAAKPA